MDSTTSSNCQKTRQGFCKNSKIGEKNRACFCCKSRTGDRERRHDCDLYGKNIGYRECDIRYNTLKGDKSDSELFKRHYKCYNCENDVEQFQKPRKKCQSASYAQNRNDSSQITTNIRSENYHSDSENDANVWKSRSKIKWGRPRICPPKKSRYHKKCVEKPFRKAPKKHLMKKSTLISDTQVEDILISEMEDRKKFKNECYCHDMVQKPMVSSSNCQKKKTNLKCVPRTRSPSPSSLYGLETLKTAKDTIEYSPESQFLRRIKNEARSFYKCTCDDCLRKNWTQDLKHTECRAAVEKSYNLEPDHRHCCDCVRVPSNSPSSTIVNLLNEASDKNYAHVCDRIHNTERIRKDNFFETHSTEEIKSCQPHNCVHKFELDDRLLPKPLNTDCYGTSRCTLCDKPMKYERKGAASATRSASINNSSGNLSKGLSAGSSFTNKQSSGSNDPRNIPSKVTTKSCLRKANTECSGSKSAIVSSSSCIKKVNIGSNNDIIDINIEPEKYFREKTVRFRPNVVPHNSLALRYQKGVI